MEEKVLIKSERYNVKKFFMIMLIIGIVVSVIGSIGCISNEIEYYNQNYDANHEHSRWYYDFYYWDDAYDDIENGGLKEYKMDCLPAYGNAFSYALYYYFEYYFLFCLIPVASFALIGGLIYLWLRSYELTVTDKRVFGRVAWGKRVDLPADSVSAIASVSLWKGVSVSTSSGKIKFLLMKNADEIYNILNNLLIERQQKKNETSSAKESNISVADELKKYKDLLDGGIISEAEFEAKKKQLLGL